MKKGLFFLSLVAVGCANNAQITKNNQAQPIVFVGTYTQNLGFVNGKGTGIYTCRMDTTNGALTVIDSTLDIANPSFLTISPDKKYLYAVSEMPTSSGEVWAYKIGNNGKLSKINAVSSYGTAPCHISMDKSGKFVYVANYGTGNVANYGVKADGSLTDSLSMQRDEGGQAWAHQILMQPNQRGVWVVDKGADKIFTYDLNPKGQLTLRNSISTAKGAGPRHLALTPDSKTAYVINELNSTINVYQHEADSMNRALVEIQTISTLPAGFNGSNTTAEIAVHPNGTFVYGSNRGHNSIAIFKIEPSTGKLNLVAHEPTQGAIPRHFMIMPDGKLLLVANQNSDTVVAFAIDGATGLLKPTGNRSHLMTPVCLQRL
ncbi:MAG: 6-phosphogluconolactonase [Bacteroidota bacterium]